MTLILESAIHEFSLADATLATPTKADLMDVDPIDFSLETVYQFAGQHKSLVHVDNPDWICLPLHDPENASLTGEYIAYTDHSLRGEIIIYADKDGGSQEYIPLEEFLSTPLARQLRFWHPDYIPDTYPEYYQAPFDDKESPTKSIDPDTFFDDLLSYLENERTAALADRQRKVTDKSAWDLYEQNQAAIPELRNIPVSEADVVNLKIDFNRIEDISERMASRRRRFITEEFGIYPDDPILLKPSSTEHAPDSFPIRGVVTNIQSKQITVQPEWNQIEERRKIKRYFGSKRTGISAVKLLNPLPYNRRREAVEHLRTDSAFREVLAGQRPLTFTQPRTAQSSPKDTELNQEQQAAVKYALLADDLFCIHGPPGTGKTRTLIEIVRRAVDAGESVLVCADSNQAVDNILVGESTPDEPDRRSLHAFGQHGSNEFTLNRRNTRQSSHQNVAKWYETVSGAADVVAATNGSAARIERQFDIVVIDEATQATIATSAIPLSKASTVILAGDHQQLPPFSKTESPPATSTGLSLFEHIYTEGGVFEDIGLQLRTQYRMHRDVAYFPNREFYDRSLQTGINIQSIADREPIVGYNIGGTEEPAGTSFINSEEASLVATLVSRIRDDGIPAEEIGVITPYAAQATYIQDILADFDQVDAHESITVDTIDAFQGSERTVILISFVRSNADGEIGFLGRPSDGPRRLNVAMTRAQRLCALIGDWTTLRQASEQAESVDHYAKLFSYLRDTNRLRDVDPSFLPV